MYTTPRKVKQESRLRRSLSLTNTASNNRSTGNATEDGTVVVGGISNNYWNQNGYNKNNLLGRNPSWNGLHVLPHSEEYPEGRTDLTQEQPPPYRDPPALGKISGPYESFHDLPNSVPDNATYHTHSSKFPFTLDSSTARDFQERLLSCPLNGNTEGTPLGESNRRNSLDLEKFVKLFSEEQGTSLSMASMQSVRMNNGGGNMEGVDNPALDLGPHGHSRSGSNVGLYNQSSKMSGYFPDSSNSQSLSSSNADSMDTVIYKGHVGAGASSSSGGAGAAHQGSQSIRDWQRSMDLDRQQQQQHFELNGVRSENNGTNNNNNSYREANLFLDSRSHHQIQQTASYQPLQFNGPGGGTGMNGSKFTMEYHHHRAAVQQVQQHQQQQQHLSVQSIPGSHTGNGNGNNGGNNSSNNNLRAGNGINCTENPINGQVNGGISLSKNYGGGSNPQLSSKSPLLTHKQLSPVPTNATAAADHHLLHPHENKSSVNKDSTKLFHTKTYNHIKDMISSRFGGAVSANNSSAKVVNGGSGGVGSGGEKLSNNNNSAQLNNTAASMNSYNNNSEVNSYHSQNLANYGHQNLQPPPYAGGAGAYYSTSPPTQSPSYTVGLANGTVHHHHPPPHTMINGNGPQPPPPASYRSPPMNDRKNVNTSFRKAIQKSTQKSNLAEDSVPQMRPILENSSATSGHNASGRDSYRYNNPLEQQQQHQQQQQASPMGIHAERAQRALDKLCEAGSSTGQFQRTGSGPILHPHSHQQQQQQFNRLPQNLSQELAHQRHKFNTKAGLGSPSGLSLHESSHTVSFSKGSGGHTNEAFQNNDEYNEPPPPLPTSQHPGQQQQQQHQQQHLESINTVGLPTILVEKRENGDGSSGSVEANKPGETQGLSQITSDLKNLAMSGEQQSSSSECEKGSQRVGSGQSHTTTDSGHGTVLLAKSPLHSSDPSEPLDAVAGQRQKFSENIADSISSGNDSEWVDIVEPEIRQILEIERAGKDGGKVKTTNNQVKQGPSGQTSQATHVAYNQGARSNQQEEPKSPTSPSKKSPMTPPKMTKNFDLSYGKKQMDPAPSTSQAAAAALAKNKSPRLPTKVHRSNSNSGSNQRLNAWSSRQRLSNDKGKSSSRKDLSMQLKAGKLSRHAMSQILYSLQDDNGDITSTTTGLDLESMLDGPTENTSDDDDLSTTIDTTDAHAIRRQLESLETMYTEVLKVLGARKFSGNRYPPSDLRNAKRRPYGSMSSLPSSVSSRPFREKKRVDDKKKVKDLKTINRRFQRLEAHVVTLARSVAHLSSEMRTQHLMVQEMESIRNEMSQLRSQVVKASMQNHANGGFARASNGRNGAMPNVNPADWSYFRNALPSLTNPSRVKKLTKFFGDEPPLIRIFLKKLGYEKYASAFEQERIGIMELPYLTEERLNKMGIPMGPRLRILQEAHMCLKPHHHDSSHQTHHHPGGGGNLSVYVV